MARKRRRLLVLAVCGLGLGSAAALTLSAFRDTLMFFVAPSDFAGRPPELGRTVRLGGMVEAATWNTLAPIWGAWRRDGRLVATLSPAKRFFPVQRMTTSEAAIHTNGFADLYVVLGDERDGAAVLRLHYNPLAPWIWLGALVMASGGLLSLADRRLRIGAATSARQAKLRTALAR